MNAPEPVCELVDVEQVVAAGERIAATCLRTPVVPVPSAERAGMALLMKAESLQPTGAFKLRGATNAVAALPPRARARGVVTHSSGNHGQALAAAAAAAGVPCTVVMPRESVALKVEATRAWGARVELVETARRQAACEEIAARTGAVVVPPFDDAAVVAGQGTVGLELLEQVPDLAVVLVPVGGGGLISGIAAVMAARAPHVRVVGVEPELAADTAEGMAAGVRTRWSLERTTRTVADGLRGAGVGALNWAHIRTQVAQVVTVDEQQIVAAVGWIAREARLVAEPSGAVAAAGWLAHADRLVDPDRPGRAVAVLSGGNVDPREYARMLAATAAMDRAREG